MLARATNAFRKSNIENIEVRRNEPGAFKEALSIMGCIYCFVRMAAAAPGDALASGKLRINWVCVSVFIYEPNPFYMQQRNATFYVGIPARQTAPMVKRRNLDSICYPAQPNASVRCSLTDVIHIYIILDEEQAINVLSGWLLPPRVSCLLSYTQIPRTYARPISG